MEKSKIVIAALKGLVRFTVSNDNCHDLGEGIPIILHALKVYPNDPEIVQTATDTLYHLALIFPEYVPKIRDDGLETVSDVMNNTTQIKIDNIKSLFELIAINQNAKESGNDSDSDDGNNIPKITDVFLYGSHQSLNDTVNYNSSSSDTSDSDDSSSSSPETPRKRKNDKSFNSIDEKNSTTEKNQNLENVDIKNEKNEINEKIEEYNKENKIEINDNRKEDITKENPLIPKLGIEDIIESNIGSHDIEHIGVVPSLQVDDKIQPKPSPDNNTTPIIIEKIENTEQPKGNTDKDIPIKEQNEINPLHQTSKEENKEVIPIKDGYNILSITTFILIIWISYIIFGWLTCLLLFIGLISVIYFLETKEIKEKKI